jgi:hypothetical protein
MNPPKTALTDNICFDYSVKFCNSISELQPHRVQALISANPNVVVSLSVSSGFINRFQFMPAESLVTLILREATKNNSLIPALGCEGSVNLEI